MIKNEFGVEVKLLKDYLVVKESLERIGICNKEKKVITPSCYILHKNNVYHILHFKELLALDGYKKSIEDIDIERRNSIITLLLNWEMIDINLCYSNIYQTELKQQIFVLKYSEKENYIINHKYCLSNKKVY